MDEYRRPYLVLWGGITDALKAAEEEQWVHVIRILIEAQQAAEDALLDQVVEPEEEEEA